MAAQELPTPERACYRFMPGVRPLTALTIKADWLQVQVGDECEVGHKAVLPAGARLKSGMHLKPRAAPSHPGAVGTGEQQSACSQRCCTRPTTLCYSDIGGEH